MRSDSLFLYSLLFPLNFVLIAGASSLSDTGHSSSTIDSSSAHSTAELSSPIPPAGNLTASSTAPSIASASISTAVVTSTSLHMPSSPSGSSNTSKAASTKPASDSHPVTTPTAEPPPPTKAPPVDPTMPTSSATDKSTASSSSSIPSGTKKATPTETATTKSSSPPSPTSHASSAAAPPPPTTPPKPTTTPPQSTTSSDHSNSTSSTHTTSTTTSVVVVHAPLSSGTASTITTQADSTFSTPVVLTSTEANGTKILTTPPLITVMSTSTEADGSIATLTHIVANPNFNGASQELASSSNTGFFHNQGAVAGVFVVVGIAIAALIAGLIFCIRRQRRRNRRLRWLAGMQQQMPPTFATNPFQDPTFEREHKGDIVEPERSEHSGQEVHQWDRASPDLLLSEAQKSRQYRNLLPQGPFSLYPDPYPIAKLSNVSPASPQEHPNFGPAYSTDMPDRSRFRHSYTPSTPSVYPATLPLGDDDRQEIDEEAIVKPVQRESSKPAPPRPPRSHLRESAKGLSYAPLTPPTSNSSHDSNPPSPISMSEMRTQDPFTRRTFLDVRPPQSTK